MGSGAAASAAAAAAAVPNDLLRRTLSDFCFFAHYRPSALDAASCCNGQLILALPTHQVPRAPTSHRGAAPPLHRPQLLCRPQLLYPLLPCRAAAGFRLEVGLLDRPAQGSFVKWVGLVAVRRAPALDLLPPPQALKRRLAVPPWQVRKGSAALRSLPHILHTEECEDAVAVSCLLPCCKCCKPASRPAPALLPHEPAGIPPLLPWRAGQDLTAAEYIFLFTYLSSAPGHPGVACKILNGTDEHGGPVWVDRKARLG